MHEEWQDRERYQTQIQHKRKTYYVLLYIQGRQIDLSNILMKLQRVRSKWIRKKEEDIRQIHYKLKKMTFHSVRCGGICNVIRVFWLYCKGCIILFVLQRLITCDAMAMVSEGTCQVEDEQDGAEAVSLHNAYYCIEF